jgi:hypothetical protein
MVKISRTDKRFTCLGAKTLAEAHILERYDLQEYIFNSREEFCKELGQDLMIIGKEVPPSKTVGDRIDLLALDRDGDVVVIELKRGDDKLQLLQAISYAGMIAKWSEEELLARAEEDLGKQLASTIKDDWMADEQAVINQSQRIVLIAEAYDYEVLVGAEWLYEKGVEIDCVRVALAVDGEAEYLTFTQVFPTPELAEQARKRGTRVVREPTFESWKSAFSASTNQAAIDFFTDEIAAGCKNTLQDRLIVLPAGTHEIRVRLREKHARATQVGRFDGDVAFWGDRLSPPATIYAGHKAGKEYVLRFHLRTAEDFAALSKAIESELSSVKWDDADPGQPAST